MYIQDISNRGKLPIIVGGTHYYIEALLWFQHLAEESTSEKEQKSEELAIESKEEETNEDEYKLLQKIDPIMAAKVHPNNKRKIKHYLEVFPRYALLIFRLIDKLERSKANTLLRVRKN